MFSANAVFLVVDDFEPMRKVTVNQLRSLGVANVVSAMHGAEALRLLKAQTVDIVLSDWNMPVMSGLDLLRAMRADDSLAQIPFIMITAEAERSQIKEAIASGVTDLLLKPYTPNRLVSQIEKAFATRGRRQVVRPPVPQAEAEATSSAAAPATVPELPQILIVDDAPDNLMLLSHIFKENYRIRLAQNGAKAIALCQSDAPPDLVLLDVMMPDMDGFEVIQRLREHPVSENIPVIFVTAVTSDEGRATGLGLGAVDYVTKPVDPDTLKLRVRNFMKYVNVQRQLQASFDDMLEMSRMQEEAEHIARHDIKGPLAGAVGLLQSVISEQCEHAQELAVVEQTIMQVLSMVNISAELLKIEKNSYCLQPVVVDLGRTLQSVVDTVRPIFVDKRLSVVLKRPTTATGAGDPPRPLAVWGEPTFCYSIFLNLLKNACEAALDATVVHIDAELGADGGTDVRVRISNQGAVPKAIRDRFFDKFVTLGKRNGTGLGSYSARLLTQAQNGSIHLAADDASNTTVVTVRLPIAP